MKKEYQNPTVEVVEFEVEENMAASGDLQLTLFDWDEETL